MALIFKGSQAQQKVNFFDPNLRLCIHFNFMFIKRKIFIATKKIAIVQ